MQEMEKAQTGNKTATHSRLGVPKMNGTKQGVSAQSPRTGVARPQTAVKAPSTVAKSTSSKIGSALK